MYLFSKHSSIALETCHFDLITLFESVIKVVDCSVLCGVRNEEEQTRAFEAGNSKLEWPNSMHNKVLSLAVDVVPYPVDWDNLYAFYYLAGVVKGIAGLRGIEVEWGGEWKTLKDYPHYHRCDAAYLSHGERPCHGAVSDPRPLL